MIKLLEKMLLIEDDLASQKLKWYEERTAKHIGLVQAAVKKIVEAFPEFEELLVRAKNHDSSKLKEPERTPYIEITWKHKEGNKHTAKGYKTPGNLPNKEENAATMHHITSNQHHPEFWLQSKSDANINSKDRDKSNKCVDASAMPDLDIAEMVADWQAMAEELQTNTAREWFNKQKDVRWHFSEHQEKLIGKLLSVFEDVR